MELRFPRGQLPDLSMRTAMGQPPDLSMGTSVGQPPDLSMGTAVGQPPDLSLGTAVGQPRVIALFLCFSLWAKHGGRSSGFSRGMLSAVTCDWLKLLGGLADSQEPAMEDITERRATPQGTGNTHCILTD